MKHVFAAVTIFLCGASAAAADWLDDAWNDQKVSKIGSPSITLNAAGEVSVSLQEPILRGALAAGLSLQDATGAFLARYAPRMCSHLLDMTVAHPGLKVDLHLQVQVRGKALFLVSQDHEDFVLNYKPTVAVHCVVPSEPVS